VNRTRTRTPRRALHGVLLLDKPVGLSSNDALQRAKWLLRAEKAGHTGTLDPLASGLLPLCFGAATKFAQVSLDADKGYRATLALGVTTSTADAEGEVTATRPVPVLDAARLQAVCDSLVGPLDQTPPMHSALKHQGRALYEYARQGLEIERPARRVHIDAITVIRGQDDRWVIDIRCSKGTYVRSLAESIGERLGCGAHLAALRRTASGALSVDDAVTLDALEALPEAAREAMLRPADRLLLDWPTCLLNADDAGRFLTGLRRRIAAPDAAAVRVYGPGLATASAPGAFLGSARIEAGELIAGRLLSPDEVAALQQRASAAAAAAPAADPLKNPSDPLPMPTPVGAARPELQTSPP
jgi:tRNA pseudouridine55 synthase